MATIGNDGIYAVDGLTTHFEDATRGVAEHKQLLKTAYVWLDEDLWTGDDGVFRTARRLRQNERSFGHGSLSLNRYILSEDYVVMAADHGSTLDLFYLSQLAAAMHRWMQQTEEDLPSADDFDPFYEQHQDLLHRDVWKDYYTTSFLEQPSSKRFFRLPNLKDLPDSDGPIGQPRGKGVGHFMKLPSWAYTVTFSNNRQSRLDVQTITDLALSTLKSTIAHHREDHPSIAPYSETQARFWLKHMGLPTLRRANRKGLGLNRFGSHVAQGYFDIWAWETHYSPERWYSTEARQTYMEPDLDGKSKSEVEWCGWPDGGIGVQAELRGWQPELGNEEEIEFLAALVVKEVEGLDADGLDYAVQSHRLLGVMLAVLEADPGRALELVKNKILEGTRLDATQVERWVRELSSIMEPYVQHIKGQASHSGVRDGILRNVLAENGQVFGRWRVSPSSGGFFNFQLKPA